MKKNQIALLCLTAVIMLAVWYIKSPVSADKDDMPTTGVLENEETGRLEVLSTMRFVIELSYVQSIASQVRSAGFIGIYLIPSTSNIELK